MKFNISAKVSFLFFITIIIFTLLLSFYFINHKRQALEGELDERIHSLMNNLSINAEYPILVGNHELILSLGRGVLKQKDVVFCEILDENEDFIYREGSRDFENIKLYASAIYTEYTPRANAEELLLGTPEVEEEKIGKINLGVSMADLDRKISDVQSTLLLVTFITVILATFFAYFFLRIILVRPVKDLVAGTKKIAEGDFSHKVAVKNKDEIGTLAQSFNHMTEQLRTTTVSKNYVDNIIKSMMDMLVVFNPDGSIRTVNNSVSETLGYDEEELTGKPARMLAGGDPRQLDIQKLMEKGSFENYEISFKSKSGESIPVSLSGAVMKRDEGKIIGLAAVAKDMREMIRLQEKEKQIAAATAAADVEKKKARELESLNRELEEANTRLKKKEQDLKKSMEELQKSHDELEDMQEKLLRKEKLTAIGRLASSVGHELRNPLGSIKNVAFYLQNYADIDDPDAQEYLKTLNEEVLSAEKILSDLLNFSRTITLKKKKLHLKELINNSMKSLNIPENVSVISNIDDDFAKIEADPDKLKQVFQNLITNAYQAMPEGKEGKIEIKALHENGKAIITVSDNAKGMDEKTRKNIFEPLFTTKAKGIGLGMSIIKSIIEHHGGTIEVESEEGKGSKFTITLPREEENKSA